MGKSVGSSMGKSVGKSIKFREVTFFGSDMRF